MFRAGDKRITHRNESFSVPAETETALRVGNRRSRVFRLHFQFDPKRHFPFGIIGQIHPVVDACIAGSIELQSDFFFSGLQLQTGQLTARNEESSLLLQVWMGMEDHPGRHDKIFRRKLLQQQIRAVVQRRAARLLDRKEPHAAIRQSIVPVRRRHCRILPIERQTIRADSRRYPAGIRYRQIVRIDGLADAVAVRVLADEGPAVTVPCHRLQMDDAPVGALVLEMQEPTLPFRRLHPSALVRPVDGTFRSGHHDTFLIGPEWIVRPKDSLPAGRNAAGRGKDIIAAVPFVEFGPFDGRLGLVSVEDDAGRPEQMRPVGGHRRHEQHALEPGTRTGRRMREPGLSVFIPQRTGIDETFGFHHPDRVFPTATRVLCPNHENTPVRIAAEDIEPAFVVTDGRRPDPVSVLDLGPEIVLRPLPSCSGIIGQRRPDQRPVHQVA